MAKESKASRNTACRVAGRGPKAAKRLGEARQAVAVPSCAYTLTLGKRHFKYAPSAYKVCITPTQAKKLFGTTVKPKPIGCGVFACAFEHSDPDKIVKITRDPSDVAGLLQGQGLAQVPKVYDSHELSTRPWWVTPRRRTERYQQWPDAPEGPFAVVVEKLHTLHGTEKSLWNKRISRMRLFKNGAEWAAIKARQENKPAPPPPTIGDMAKAVCPKAPAREAKSCQLRVRELNKMSEDLKAIGVEWTDLHAGNIGADAKGRWKALDLGASTTPLETQLPVLERASGSFPRSRG